MRTPQSERTPVAQQVFPKKTWSRKPPPKCACLLTFQEGVPSASRGLHDPTRRVGPSVPRQEGREVRMRRPSPPGGSAAQHPAFVEVAPASSLPSPCAPGSAAHGRKALIPPGGPEATRGPGASGRSLVSAASLLRAGPASSSSTERPVTR